MRGFSGVWALSGRTHLPVPEEVTPVLITGKVLQVAPLSG